VSRALDLYEKLRQKGAEGIKEIIDPKDPWTEHLFVDYKQSRRQKEIGPVHEDDRRNLAKAISGFGNSSGGLIVWGVKCKKGLNGVDIPTKAAPLKEVVKFRSQIEGLISGFTMPAHNGVESHTFIVNDDGDGYLLTYIPKSDYAPLRSLKHDQYFWRSGSSFQPVSHDALAGMFGKRPEPKIELVYKKSNSNLHHQREVWVESIFEVKNSGVAVERDVYFTFIVKSKPGGLCTVSPSCMGDIWVTNSEADEVCIYSKEGVRLPPMSSWPAFRLAIRVSGTIEQDLNLVLHYGCLNSRPRCFSWHRPKEFFEQVLAELVPKTDGFPLSPEQLAAHRNEISAKLVEYREAVFALDREGSES